MSLFSLIGGREKISKNHIKLESPTCVSRVTRLLISVMGKQLTDALMSNF